MDREEPVITGLDEVWGSVVDACTGLSDEQWRLPTDCPGWSVQDQVSHLIGIERIILGEPPPAWEGGDRPHLRNPIGRMNEAPVEARRSRPGDEVLSELEEVIAQRSAHLRTLRPADFDEIGWSPVGPVPHRRFMELRIFDTWVHEQDIRRAVDRPGGRFGVGETVTVAQVVGALPYIVGKKVAPPDGTTVTFVVTDPVERTFAVGVQGRAHPLDDAPERPSATIRTSSEWFWRLGCGRGDRRGALGSGTVTLDGDRVLAGAVLDAMVFLI